MAHLPEQFLQKIRDHLPVSAVVGRKLKIRREGREFRAIDDNSLTISDVKCLWWDHSKNEGGDIFDWYVKREGMEFRQAVEECAAQAGMPVPKENGKAYSAPRRGPGGAIERDEVPFAPVDGAEAVNPTTNRAKPVREIVKTYDYTDAAGDLLYQVVRLQFRTPSGEWERGKDGRIKKTFAQRRPSGENGIWIWGLGAGEFMRKGPRHDWYQFNEKKFGEWNYSERRRFDQSVEHGLYRLVELREEMADGRQVWICYSPDTEVLTPTGWVAFPDLQVGVPVAQWEISDQSISFCIPSAQQKFSYTGQMVFVQADWCGLLVTPDHRQPTTYKAKQKVYGPKIIPASLIRHGLQLPTSGILNGDIGGPTEREARLITAWLADGVWEPRGDQISWNLKKERKKARLRALLTDLDIEWSEHHYPSTPGWTNFRLKKRDLDFVWYHAPEKRWPWDAVQWSKSARYAILSELRHWDGDSGKVSSFRFFTSDKQSADVISAIAAVTGHHASMRLDARRGRKNYILNVTPRLWRELYKTPTKIDYSGLVYCCTVDTGFLVVRRHGKVTISGNCEGEKDADTLWDWGIPATTNSGGAKNWRPDHAETFRGMDVVVPVDNDEAGRAHGEAVAKSLRGIAKRVRVLDWRDYWPGAPDKADVTDWRDQEGGTVGRLLEIAAALPTWTPAPYISKFGALPWERLDEPGVEHEFIIDGWLTVGDKSIIGGPSKSGKSFLAIHASMAIARCTEFFGQKVMCPGLVIYQAGEGARGIKKRLRAYRKHFDVPWDEHVPFVLLQSKIDLYRDDGDTDALIDEIKALAEQYDVPLRAVFIDTLATATGGADENSGRDMSAVMANVDKINAATGAHVCLVHHMNAAGTKLRGHTSIYANIDQVITVTRDEMTKIRTAVLDKQKDGEDGQLIRFELMSVQIGSRQLDGEPITSCVTLDVGEREAVKSQKPGFKLTQQEELVFRALVTALGELGRPPPAERKNIPPQISTVVTYKEWRDTYARSAPIDEDSDDAKRAAAVKKAMQRAGVTLLSFGIIGRDNPFVWWSGKPVRGFGKDVPTPPLQPLPTEEGIG